jgi:hypothetical protein
MPPAGLGLGIGLALGNARNGGVAPVNSLLLIAGGSLLLVGGGPLLLAS